MNLGSEDDLGAVLTVLDRLSNELATNRMALGASLTEADAIGMDLPLSLITPEKQTELAHKIKQETADCEILRHKIDELMGGVAQAALLVREVADSVEKRNRAIHKTANRDLLAWKTEVEQLADECTVLGLADAHIDHELAKFLTRLESEPKGACALTKK